MSISDPYSLDVWVDASGRPQATVTVTNGGASDVEGFKFSVGSSTPTTQRSMSGSSGTFTFTPEFGLTTISARLIDRAGNQGPIATAQVKVMSPEVAHAWVMNDGYLGTTKDLVSDSDTRTGLDLGFGKWVGSTFESYATRTGGNRDDEGGEAWDRALHFDGTGPGATTEVPAIDTSNSFTVTARARVDDLAEGGEFAVASQGQVGDGYPSIRLEYSGSQWRARVRTPGVTKDLNSGIPLKDEVGNYGALGADGNPDWQHLALTYDANQNLARFYVDGDLAAELTSWEFDGVTDDVFRVGRRQNGSGTSGPGKGKVDDIVVFDAAQGTENIRRLVGADTEDDVSRQLSQKAPDAQFDDPVAVGSVPTVPLSTALGAYDPDESPRWGDDTVWPQPLSATVTVPEDDSVQAGDSPVWLSAAAIEPDTDVEVEVMDQQTSATYGGQVAVRLAADTADAEELVEVTIDYTGFEHALGGDYGSRLVASVVDADCVDAGGSDCAVETLETANDPVAGELTATVPVAAQSSGSTVVFLSASDSGPAGDWSATPLQASGEWSHGGSSGGFNWSYPLRTPEMPGGLQPDLSIGYSSQSIDGRTTSTNNQTSWVGEGFDLGSGFIERRYISCAEDTDGDANNADHKTGDLCWKSDNAILNLGGTSTELIKDSSTGEWRPKSDDASRVEHLTGAGNGDDDGEYWRVTTTDGTQYYFGKYKRYEADTKTTNSLLRTPVAGNHSGEPCHASKFADSFCDQGWRWMLDYVVDADDNTMTYFYGREANRYGKNLDDESVLYHRGVTLNRIEYGQRKGSEHSSPAAAKVTFTTAERCIGSDCDAGDLTKSTADDWPDVPFDRICDSTNSCDDQFSPTFFSRKRLVQVDTWVLRTDGNYERVDQWKLDHSFPDPGDGNDPALWLKSIQHNGYAGSGSIALPKVQFYGIQLPNRVDGVDSAPPLNRWRLRAIRSETGAVTSVNYADPECSDGDVPSNEHDNGMRCYPVYWNFEGSGEADPHRHWFHKHVVESIIATDRTGDGVSVDTHYAYSGDGAWAYDDNEFVDAEYRTWGQWRGFAKVTTTVGDSDTDQLKTQRTYMRGMHGDRESPSGGSRSVEVADSHGRSVTDYDEHAGFVREQIVFDGGDVVSSTVHDPWRSGKTADDGDEVARMTNVASIRVYTRLEDGSDRVTATDYTYDSDGLTTSVHDRGDTSISGDDRCARTEYVKNTSKHILQTPKRVETVSVGCDVSVTRPQDVVVSEGRFSYDGGEYGQAPTRGHVWYERELDSWDGDTRKYVVTGRYTHDDVGRVTSAKDALNRTTSTAYTPAGAGPLTKTVVTNPAGHTTTTSLDRYLGQPTKVVDANGKATTAVYDPLGRLTDVWLTDRNTSLSPSMQYAYRVSADEPVAVTSKSLLPDGGYATSVQLYDSLLRERQVQAPSGRDADTGRIIASTEFDSRGLPVTVKGPFYNQSANPGKDIVDPRVVDPSLTVQRRVESMFDGAGRQVREEVWSHQTRLSTATTAFGGDRTHTTPPSGGTASTVITDVRGNIAEKRDYTDSGSPSGAFQTTKYSYTPRDELATVTDPAGNQWSYEYDLRGRRTVVDDPDAGVSTSVYDAASQVTSTTDARDEALTYTYDVLGRKTAIKDGSGATLSSWEFDTLAKGQVSSSTSYTGGDAYTRSVTGYDDGYRPLGETVTIPAAQGGLAGDYTTGFSYNVDGSVDKQSRPGIGGLPAEVLEYHYDQAGNPEWLQGARTYTADASYTPYGELEQLALGANYRRGAWETITYTEGTRRLYRVRVDLEGVNDSTVNRRYGWDDAGNPAWIVDYAGADDRQCFEYDHLRRLTQAWTQDVSGCQRPSPDPDAVGGPAPYWHTYTYDVAGNRTQKINHGIDGGSDTTSSYTYPAAGADQPHTLTKAGTATYSYDQAGNTTSKTAPGAEGPSVSTFGWDAQGRLTTLGTPGGFGTITGDLIYDADGGLLLREDPGTLASELTVTLFAHGDEITLTPDSGEITGVRNYTFAGKNVATQQGADTHADRVVSTMIADHFGTPLVAIDENNNVTKRFQDPFGNHRGGTQNLPGQTGFHTGIENKRANLVTLGARHYDPATGRFISVDPLIDVLDSQQINGYTYANNNPLAYTDPTGLMLDPGNGGGAGPGARPGGGSGGGRGGGAGSTPHAADTTATPHQPTTQAETTSKTTPPS